MIYSLVRLENNLFVVVVPDDYDRAMLFLRAQEYSDSPRYKGKSFDFWDFMKSYSLHNNSFTYPDDWIGFNVSYQDAIECYKKLPSNADLTPYDLEFLKILKKIAHMLESLDAKAYIIGVDSLHSRTMLHEKYHSRYYLDREYRGKVNHAIKKVVPKSMLHRMKDNLKQMGYSNDSYTINNEIQSYLRGSDWNHPDFSKGIPINQLKKVHKQFKRFLGTTKDQ